MVLIDDDPVRGSWVERCLQKSGFDTCVIDGDHVGVLKQISDRQPDVIVIDMDSPGRDILESLSIVSTHQPTPVVMFSPREEPTFIDEAVNAGVTAYIVGGIQPEKVKPVIDVAISQFRSFQSLRQRLSDAEAELEDRKSITSAVMTIMEQGSLDEPTAYDLLRKQAMDERVSIGEVARRILQRKQ